MKHLFLCCLSVLCVTVGTIFQAAAKDPEDLESDHVIVTLKSGEKVDCYILMQKVPFLKMRTSLSKSSKLRKTGSPLSIRPMML